LTNLEVISYTLVSMPITKQAEKKLRHDKKRAVKTAKQRSDLREVIKELRKKPSKKGLNDAYKALDKAAKLNVIHANKASRLKGRLSKLLAK
jgi:small subunit ribosomal protein S20